jgi:CRISPR-associated endonuclease/helicase Cas3
MLGIEHFEEFFGAMWAREDGEGHRQPLRPFDWQVQLLSKVRSAGWPSTLDLPTGAGKTATLDIALFALALDAFVAPDQRRQPRRIVLVVDRRVVVDQAYHRAVHLASQLQSARGGVLARVAEALRSLQCDSAALPVMPAILRGGMPRESEWARTPHQPAILVSTVDQVGSRLLFRGYGVSDSMKPIHAGLLGRDTLYLLDEVHLSRPFEQTLDAIATVYAHADGLDATSARPIRVVRMSATVAERPDDTFSWSEADRPTLGPRLSASKRARLRTVDTPSDPLRARDLLARACVEETHRIVAGGARRVIAAIVNRVDTARRIAMLASDELPEGWSVRLMTGRMRPLDRADLERDLVERIRAGRTRTDERILVVSTQAIEAGADFDFDALITECASLDALRQRFGRLDRMGDLVTTEAVVLAASSDVAESAGPDPIYGNAICKTWSWLRSPDGAPNGDVEVVDFGVDAMNARVARLADAKRSELLTPKRAAPVLVGSHLDRWVQTLPQPSADPDIAAFLHGPDRGTADVHVVWRADIDPAAIGEPDLEGLSEMLDVVPPSALEALSLPIWAVRTWLGSVAGRSHGQQVAVPAIADVEGTTAPVDEDNREMAPALVWRGDTVNVARKPKEIKPGDTLVVPAFYGGISQTFACWDPEASEPVVDRGDEAQLFQRARAVVRWHPEVLREWNLPDVLRSGPNPRSAEDEVSTDDARLAFEEWRNQALMSGKTPAWVQCLLSALATRTTVVEVVTATGAWRATRGSGRISRDDLRRLTGIAFFAASDSADATTENDGGSFLGTAISLDQHLDGVASFANRFGLALSLTETLTNDITLAARLHDLGKADPRFQLMLHGGDPVRHAVASTLLAKSELPATDRAARERARIAARYPRGMRHELMSVALVEANPTLAARAHDWDLVLHLVASHHGWCRPLAPPIRDREPVNVHATFDGISLSRDSDHALARVDSGVTERFWRLVRRYGWWGLAWLEAIVRLADHRESEKEQRDG